MQREIAGFILSERYEGITGLLTIIQVEATADLAHAKVYFSIVGQDDQEVLKILNQHIYEIQGRLYKNFTMRQVPRIVFVPDTSGSYAGRIGELLKDIHKHDQSGA